MAPNLLGNSTLFLAEANSAEPVQIISKPGFEQQTRPLYTEQSNLSRPRYKWQVVWRNVLIFLYLHVAALYGLHYFIVHFNWKTALWFYIVTLMGSIGITMGAHRLWAHRSYKANFPLRLLLALGQTIALQNDIYEWVRDHRVHHKFTETDADPHNSDRGFFFSHMGWLLVKKHKDVFVKGKTIDMSDVAADPIVQFQRKYYLLLAPTLCLIIPTIVPWYFWNETFSGCWNMAIFKYVVALHGTWLVNSAAHIWGSKPFDKTINASDNRAVAVIAFGEGWHNYHHVFPWDYKAAELGDYSLNVTTGVIDFMAKIGWAYDLKTVPIDIIFKRAKRTGDGSKKLHSRLTISEPSDDHHHGDNIWGWGDKDMEEEDIKMAEIHHSKLQKDV